MPGDISDKFEIGTALSSAEQVTVVILTLGATLVFFLLVAWAVGQPNRRLMATLGSEEPGRSVLPVHLPPSTDDLIAYIKTKRQSEHKSRTGSSAVMAMDESGVELWANGGLRFVWSWETVENVAETVSEFRHDRAAIKLTVSLSNWLEEDQSSGELVVILCDSRWPTHMIKRDQRLAEALEVARGYWHRARHRS